MNAPPSTTKFFDGNLTLELVDLIVEFFSFSDARQRVQVLLHCCLVSRAFRTAAQARLFSTVDLTAREVTGKNYEGAAVSSETTQLFQNTLTDNSPLARHVECLTFRVSPLLPPDFCSRFLFQFESALPNLKYLGVHGNAEDWRRLPLKTREVLLKNVFPKMKGVKFEKLYLLPFCGVFKSFTNLHALCLDWISPGHAGASDDCCCSTLLRQNPPALDVLELRGYREFDLDPGYCFSKVLQLSRKKLKTLMLGRSTVEYGGNLVSFFNVFARRFGESLVNVYLGIELCETILAPIVQWGPFAHVQGHFLDLASLPRLEELYIELPPLEDFGPWPVEIQQQKWISQLSPFFLGLAQNFGSAFQQPLTPRCCCPALRLLSFSAASWNPQSLVDNGFQITDSQHEEGSEPTWIAFDDVLAGEILLPELRDVRFEKGLGIFDGLILLLPRSAQKGILSIGDEGREDHSIGIFRYV